MKKTVKRLIMLTVMAVVILAFSGCPLFTGLPANMGVVLSVDADGHFKVDVVYTMAYSSFYAVWTFSEDGSYQWEFYDWDGANETWVQTDGLRGTYTWDSKTFIFQRRITNEYDFATETWATPAWVPYTESYPGYFTDQMFYGWDSVFLEDEDNENTYIAEYSYSDAEGDMDDDSNTITFSDVEVGGTFTLFRSRVRTDGTGIWDQDEYETTGDIINIFPDGTKFRKGDTATFLVSASYRQRDWDDATGWGAWTTPTKSRESKTFLNLGKAIIENPSVTAARELSP